MVLQAGRNVATVYLAQDDAQSRTLVQRLSARHAVKATQPSSGRLQVEFKPAVRSLATMNAARASLRDNSRLAALVQAVHVEDYLDVRDGKVELRVTRITPELAAEVAKRGDAISLSVAAEGRPRRASSRDADSAPYSAGLNYDYPAGVAKCSGGFAVRAANGQQQMLTAGHCGEVGQVLTTHSVYVGRIVEKHFSQKGYDSARFAGSTYEGWSWTGPGGTAQGKTLPVKLAMPSSLGDTVCYSGAVSGERCGAHVDNVDVCVTFDDEIVTCRVVKTSSPAHVIDYGDSGGPVYRYRTSNTLYAMGTIIGFENVAGGGQRAYYHPIDILLSHWGVTLITG